MTMEERAACIADISLGGARGSLRRQRIYEKSLQMLRETEGSVERALLEARTDAVENLERCKALQANKDSLTKAVTAAKHYVAGFAADTFNHPQARVIADQLDGKIERTLRGEVFADGE